MATQQANFNSELGKGASVGARRVTYLDHAMLPKFGVHNSRRTKATVPLLQLIHMERFSPDASVTDVRN
jgi:hypothetical protein